MLPSGAIRKVTLPAAPADPLRIAPMTPISRVTPGREPQSAEEWIAFNDDEDAKKEGYAKWNPAAWVDWRSSR